MLTAGLATAAVLATGCGSSSPGSSAAVKNPPGVKLSGTVIVFAAASLNSAFDKLGSQFEKMLGHHLARHRVDRRFADRQRQTCSQDAVTGRGVARL